MLSNIRGGFANQKAGGRESRLEHSVQNRCCESAGAVHILSREIKVLA